MKISSIKYFFKEAFKSIYKNALMSFASVITVASCIAMLIVSFSVAATIDLNLTARQNSISIMLFINDGVSAERVIEINDEITSLGYIESTKFLSSEDAFDEYETKLGDKAYILEGLPRESLLRRSFEITLQDVAYRDDFIAKMQTHVGEDKEFASIDLPEDEIKKLVDFGKGVRIASIFLILSFSFISIIIIMNTIKITLSNRQTEINIMKYIGATDWFIRWPLVIEGIIIGLVGAIIPIIIGVITYSKVTNGTGVSIEEFINTPGFILYSTSEIFSIIIPFSICMGILLGVVGSLTSIRQYLKV